MPQHQPLTVTDFQLTGDWYPQAAALLDEQHLVAVSENENLRVTFGSYLAMQAERLQDSEVCPIYGRFVRSLEELAYMLGRGLATRDPVAPNISAITDDLRHSHRETRLRYILWHDADVMAVNDPDMFHQVADAMMGVAAEQEFASDDRLVVTRCVFIGSTRLLDQPAFSAWWSDTTNQPLWQVVSGLASPPIQGIRLHPLR